MTDAEQRTTVEQFIKDWSGKCYEKTNVEEYESKRNYRLGR